MWALKRANLRIGPEPSFDKVGVREVGEEVRITGEAGRWLRVACKPMPSCLAV